jgi:hypothetical protein
MTALPMPDERLLRHFPEATTLAVLDAALAATELDLGEEHPAAVTTAFFTAAGHRRLEPGVGVADDCQIGRPRLGVQLRHHRALLHFVTVSLDADVKGFLPEAGRDF